MENNFIKISRDCDGVLIPSGDSIKILKDTPVKITQSLGGYFTLYVNAMTSLVGKYQNVHSPGADPAFELGGRKIGEGSVGPHRVQGGALVGGPGGRSPP